MSKNGKGKQNYGKKNGKYRETQNPKGEVKGVVKESRTNDINWWNKSVTYADAVRVPFNRIAAAVYNNDDFHSSNEASYGLYDYKRSLPFGMRLNYVPCTGVSYNQNSPVNRCFTSLYAAVYAKTTGAMQFQQADLAICTTALSSILIGIGNVKRALGLSTLYSGMNMAFPRYIVSMVGFDPETIIGHQDEVRAHLNDAIMNLNALRLPSFTDLFARNYQLATQVYADQDDIRAQFSAFVPSGYYMYTEASDNQPERLIYNRFEDDIMDVFEYIQVINRQLNAIRNSSSFALVSGSLQRAFPDGSLISIEPVTIDYTVVPVPDRNMMWQINNADIVGTLDTDSLTITCDPVTNTLQFNPCGKDTVEVNAFTTNMQLSVVNRPLVSYDGDTSDEFIMEATRLKTSGKWDKELGNGSTTGKYRVTHCGTEIVETAQLYQLDLWGTGEPNVKTQEFTSYFDASQFEAASSSVSFLHDLAKFRNAPMVIFYIDGNYVDTITGDFNVWTTLDEASLAGLHKAALLSIYRVDQLITIK